jgi:hypothetical protein
VAANHRERGRDFVGRKRKFRADAGHSATRHAGRRPMIKPRSAVRSARSPSSAWHAGNGRNRRDRSARNWKFESISLHRRVCELLVPQKTAPVVRSHDPFAVERPVGRKGSDRQSAASDVRGSGRSRRTGFGLLPPWPQPVGTSSTCCAIARNANSASSPCKPWPTDTFGEN